MKLAKYLKATRGEAARIASELSVSRAYVSQLAAGTAVASPKRCIEIEALTCGRVSRRDLRPKDWHQIWPQEPEAA